MTKPKTDSDQGAKPTRKPRKPKVTKPDPLTIQGVPMIWQPDDGTAPDSQTATSDTVSVHCANDSNNKQDTTPMSSQASEDDRENGTTATPQLDNTNQEQAAGDVPSAVAESATEFVAYPLVDGPLARARDGETRKQCWERLRQEARTAGMTRRDAISYAGRMVDQVWIAPLPPEPEPVEVEPIAVEPEPVPEPETSPAADKPAADSLVFTVPPAWPELPDNASLQAEIAWVSANRLRVRDGSGVDLSRAKTPAPSYSALSWLETSILFPSKFADISVKATANQDDEKELIRREKASIEEVRAILAEMLED